MRAAFITSVSLGYWPGFCAFLRSLELYGHKEDVVALLYEDISVDKVDRLKAVYPNVQVGSLASIRRSNPVIVDPRGIRGWDCRFYQYWFAANYLSYDVYCFWGGDVLLLNNISKYIAIGEKNTVLSNNLNYLRTKRFLGSRVDEDSLTPLCHIPFITSSKRLLEKIWEEGHSVRDKGRGDMRCTYNALCDLKMLNEVFILPISQWTGSRGTCFFNPIQVEGDGYYLPDGVRINAVHGRLWSKGFVEKRSKAGGLLYRNYELFHQIYLDRGREI